LKNDWLATTIKGWLCGLSAGVLETTPFL